ncbi:hypothetical protein [Streptomyces sp. 147326]|uniref:hypothetical protein n=1 Tax=Streptomyces sp. 147326 TaxID=3074379 RepID=UPI0038577CF3
MPTGPATGAPDAEGAVAATAARLTGPVLGSPPSCGHPHQDRLGAPLRHPWSLPSRGPAGCTPARSLRLERQAVTLL